jgi:hypothetical protein
MAVDLCRLDGLIDLLVEAVLRDLDGDVLGGNDAHAAMTSPNDLEHTVSNASRAQGSAHVERQVGDA